MYIILLDDRSTVRRFFFFTKALLQIPSLEPECFFETFSEANTLFAKLKKQDINLFVKSKVINSNDIFKYLAIDEINEAISQLIREQDKNEKH